MNIWSASILAVLVSYLLGSIPFGLLIAKSRGVDIRKTGSCNIGATNVMRSVGKSWGILTLLLDALKGFIPAALFTGLLQTHDLALHPSWLKIACGFAAILGHNFPVYLRFKGGKGVATSSGVLLGIAPLAFLIGFFCFALVFAFSRYVSLGAVTAAIVIPVVSLPLYYKDHGPFIPTVLAVLGILVIWRHKANIRRLINGTENKITFRKQ